MADFPPCSCVSLFLLLPNVLLFRLLLIGFPPSSCVNAALQGIGYSDEETLDHLFSENCSGSRRISQTMGECEFLFCCLMLLLIGEMATQVGWLVSPVI